MVSGRFLPRLPACFCANRPNSTSLVLVGSRVRPNLPSRRRKASCTRRASDRYWKQITKSSMYQPTPDQVDQARVADSMFDKSEDPIVIEAPKEVLQIRLQHPANHAAGDDLIEGRQGVMGAKLRPAAERAGQEVLLVDGGQHLSRGALERPVGDSWNPEGALLRLARLGDIDPPNVRRTISLAVDGLEHRLYPPLEALLRRLHRLTIHPGCGSLRNL